MKNREILIAIFVILIISISMGYAYLNTDLNINSNVHLKSNKPELTYYIDNKISSLIPSKGTGYSLDTTKSTCTNNATIKWDINNWKPLIENITKKPTCNLYFKKTEVTITLDLNGGTSDTTTVKALYSGKYNIPSPTKEGYTFGGWTRNIASELNNNNYKTINYYQTPITELGINDSTIGTLIGFHIIGYQGNNVDTYWDLISKNRVPVISNNNYILSFYVRSKNSIDKQVIKKIDEKDWTFGKTSLYCGDLTPTGYDSVYYDKENTGNIDGDKDFENDGNWHLITATIKTPLNATSCYIDIGNDIPNLCGKESYLDIANVQLTKGIDYTPPVINTGDLVTITEDTTFKAIWK